MPGPFDPDNFGDGSNRWIPGIVETAQNPVDRASDPYDTIAGAADAAALNFDEGVGGLVSLVDSDPGNTAGPGESPFLEDPREGQPSNPTRDSPLSRLVWSVAGIGLVIAVVVALGQLFTFNFNVGDSTE
jgi:hypothetical protein